MLREVLSPEEMTLVFNADWLLMKHRIMEKAILLLGKVQAELALLPALQAVPDWQVHVAMGAKISKGERYKDLPYAILDYPRYFSRDDIFALRTMFWWGHDFTGTLHLAGASLVRYRDVLREGLPALQQAGAQVYLPEDAWEHEIGAGIYVPLSECSTIDWERALQRDFLKLAAPFPLGAWEQVVPDVIKFYAVLLEVLQQRA